MEINKDLILKYNQPGPRYTSYPPANYFHSDITVEDYKRAIIQSNNEHDLGQILCMRPIDVPKCYLHHKEPNRHDHHIMNE